MSTLRILMSSADRFISTKDWIAARTALSKILSIENNASAHVKLSYLESICGNHALANRHAYQAYMLHPTDVETSLRMMNRLRHFNESGALYEYISKSNHFETLGSNGLHSVAAHLSHLEEHEKSLAYFNKVVELQPNSPAPLLARAQIHMFLGDFRNSRHDLQSCIRLAPTAAQAWWTLSQIRKSTFGDNSVPELRRMLASSVLPTSSKAYLAFALHKELDDLGQYRDAADALTLGCSIRRKDQNYSDSQSTAIFRKISRFGNWVTAPDGNHSHCGFVPIFIVGMFRSGTTLLERLISAHPQVRSGGELRDVSSCLQYATDHHCKGIIDEANIDRLRDVDFQKLGARYFEKAGWRLRGRTHLTDKMPANFLNVGVILSAIPNAKVLHMSRDPVSTCFSNLREHFSGLSPYSYDQRELASYYSRYLGLMEYWHKTFPGKILDVEYDRLTGDTENMMREVSAFCGLDFKNEMLDPRSGNAGVATASAVQVREPISRRSAQKWEPYAEYLSPLISSLKELGSLR